MKGQVFTIAKLHYINGVVYFAAQEGRTDLTTLAQHFADTTKSGDVKHPKVRVRTLLRLAQGIGLVERPSKEAVQITQLGREYYEARGKDKWSLSTAQRELLRNHILSEPSGTPTIHSIFSLLTLVKRGYTGKTLATEYAKAIGKQDAWQSSVTYEGFTNFGLNYLRELDFLDANLVVPHDSVNKNTKPSPPHKSKTFLFTWNPTKWTWDDLPQAVYEANLEGKYLDQWSCGATRKLHVGDRAFLMRLGLKPKGIMGSGVVVSEPFEDLHWDAERASRGDKVYRVEILFDVLNDTPILTEKELSSGALSQHNWFPQGSGTTIPEQVATILEEAWSKRTGTSFSPPDEADIPRLHAEGTKRSRLVTTYERNPQARKDCLRHYGPICQACGLSFEERYGVAGKGFIHVHHIVPVSDIQEEYKVDPVADLRPVCPNCHAMIHKRTPPYSIDDIKGMISTSNKAMEATS